MPSRVAVVGAQSDLFSISALGKGGNSRHQPLIVSRMGGDVPDPAPEAITNGRAVWLLSVNTSVHSRPHSHFGQMRRQQIGGGQFATHSSVTSGIGKPTTRQTSALRAAAKAASRIGALEIRPDRLVSATFSATARAMAMARRDHMQQRWPER